MTTDELIAELKARGVSDSDAEGMRDLHLESQNVGRRFKIPCLVPGSSELVMVSAEFTGADELFVPKWLSVA